jgi:hypothetical protein
MDDGYTDQFVRADAEAAIRRDQGCADCADFAACKHEGACILTLELAEQRSDNCSECGSRLLLANGQETCCPRDCTRWGQAAA